MNRRHFLQSSVAASLSFAPLVSQLAAQNPGRKPRMLLRNAWQSINIGDIAHYIGLFELLAKHGIDPEIRFWASNLENGADGLVKKYWPHVQVIRGNDAVAAAFKECDFMLNGSGSDFPAWRDLARWQKETGKPNGVMGVTVVNPVPEMMETLNRADFAYFRDGNSVKVVKENGCTNPIAEFGPDTAFGVVKTRDDASAEKFMKEHDLQPGKFMCCIPRYRWTPKWTIDKKVKFVDTKQKRNDEMSEHDHAPHRDAIIAVVRETGMKVLITCEDQTQIQLGKDKLYDPLPADVKKNVVWRDRYWLTDEALSTFVRSAGLFGSEMHSPIMCIANDIPAVVCRFDEQTKKGLMWRDIGLDNWLFDLDQPDEVARIAPTVLAIAKDPAAAKAKAAQAREIVLAKQKQQMQVLAASLAKSVQKRS
jgi:polysaccharide pyruvyl transferase WcaK-like protein